MILSALFLHIGSINGITDVAYTNHIAYVDYNCETRSHVLTRRTDQRPSIPRLPASHPSTPSGCFSTPRPSIVLSVSRRYPCGLEEPSDRYTRHRIKAVYAMYIYIYTYLYAHTHIHVYIYICIYIIHAHVGVITAQFSGV